MTKIFLFITIGLILLASCAPVVTVRPLENPTAPVSPTPLPSMTPSPTAQATPTHTASPTAPPSPTTPPSPTATDTQTPVPATETAVPTVAVTVRPTAGTVTASPPLTGNVPVFDHIVLMLFENHGYADVIGSQQMPNLNRLASEYVLLDQYHAVRHPSLPNYIALMSGDTHNITKDCNDCYVDVPNLADLIELSGRTWKDYQEDMPSPCFAGDKRKYVQKHNPFMYFDNIRLNSTRCEKSVVPLSQLDADLAANQLPNFAFIMPNLCNSGHDCELDVADRWLGAMVAKLQNSTALGQNSLIIITFDEGDGSGSNESCCGLAKKAGGRIAAVLVSPQAKAGFNDNTPYSHYSLLKTILMAWGMPDLGKSAMPETQPIVEPWK